MAKINVMNAIEEARKEISSKYDVKGSTLIEIIEMFQHPYLIASNAFCLGYGQGKKAAEIEKDSVKEEKLMNITLTKDEALDLEMYFALTHQRITDELEVWESLKDDPTAPAAGKNLIFWKEIETLINKISKELR